jgi:signal transduction histidine kinase/CheY-like chemotaxis protein
MGKLRSAILLSFRSKLLIPVLLIMAGLVAAISWLISVRVTAQAEADATRKLETAELVFRKSREIHGRNLLQRFTSLQNDARYKATFQTGDRETTQDFLRRELGSQVGVDIMTFTLEDGEPLASVQRDPLLPGDDFINQCGAAVRSALAGVSVGDTVHLGNRLMDVVSIPIYGISNERLGALSVGSILGAEVAQELSTQTRCQVVFIAAGRILTSTLNELSLSEPGQKLLRSMQTKTGMVGDQVRSVLIDGKHYYASYAAFDTLSSTSDLGFVMLSSYEDELLALSETRRAIFLIGGIGILLGCGVVWFFVSRVVAPLEVLRDSVEVVAGGDLSHRVEVNTNDECADLAVGFNRMVSNLQNSRAELESTLERLKTTQAQLVQSEKLSGIGEFVAGVAHELNNPLTTVMGFSEMLHRNCADERQLRQLDMVHKSAKRCHRIVQNLLSFARRRQPERKPVNINKLLQSSGEFLEYQMRTSNVEMMFKLDPNLPRAHADPHQLQQVFINLLNNARQAIEGHHPSGTIIIQTETAGDAIQILVRDDGPGISSTNLKKIFNPFFTTKEVGKGTGLGLSLCYGLIKEHGGTIEVKSEPGRGAEFIIQLPASSEAASAELDTTYQPRMDDTAFGNGRPVLVVDDEEGIVEMLGELLRELGFHVDTATNGESALQRTSNKRYDAVFCDWKMPGLSGQQVYERMRLTEPGTADRMIFVTGDVATESTRQFLESERRPFVAKPFTIRDLRAALQSVLAGN